MMVFAHCSGMVRRTPPQKLVDDAAFPVRMMVLVPSDGFGVQFHADFTTWLDREVGRADYAQHPAQGLGERVLAFYFRRPTPAARFLRTFPTLVLADGTASAAYASPALPFGRK